VVWNILGRVLPKRWKSIRHAHLQREPGIYFNKEELSTGELLKILAYIPEADNYVLSFKVHQSDGQFVLEKPLERIEEYQLKTLNTSNSLDPGSYTVQVFLEEEKLGEHQFCVFGEKDYTAYGHTLFGKKWDFPIYWDTLRPNQEEKLIYSCPLDNLEENLKCDGTTLYRILGPLTAAYMTDEGPLPFSVHFKTGSPPYTFPPIDLVKFLWSVNVLAPTLADKAFFSSESSLAIEADRKGIAIHFEYGDTRYLRSSNDGVVPPLYPIMKEILGDKFHVDWERGQASIYYGTESFKDSGS